MLFNSTLFIFTFLPITLLVYYLLAKKNHEYSLVWLSVASLFFYGYWKIIALPILLLSITFNYLLSKFFLGSASKSKWMLIFGIVANVGALAYFKYLNFFTDNLNIILSALNYNKVSNFDIFLPLGISFYTFTQIAYLIDRYRGEGSQGKFIHYFLFVTFFPHLIAGPIIYHKKVIPQFSENLRFSSRIFAQGISIFIIGLAKKVVLADTLANQVNYFYSHLPSKITTCDAWIASISYTLQLYFDFSGYSDMAIGLALLFGIYLPINFNSPLKAKNIIEFWQRWHLSLTSFINKYLYTSISLYFTRVSFEATKTIRTIMNLIVPNIIVFFIIGLWHGASWNYILFGFMHGCFIIINHLWKRINLIEIKNSKLKNFFSWAITIISINFTFIIFRSENINNTVKIIKAMIIPNMLTSNILNSKLILIILIAIFIVLFGNNTQSLFNYNEHKKNNTLEMFSIYKSFFLGLILLLSLLMLKKPTPFLYFNF